MMPIKLLKRFVTFPKQLNPAHTVMESVSFT